MSSSDSPSKRERQKQRRNAKLEQQRIDDAKARRNRLIVFGVLGLIFVGLIGVAVAQQRAQRAALLAQEEEAQAQYDEFGCTDVETMESLGGGHLDGSSLAQQPPEALYPDQPGTSGQHIGNWLKTGVYDVALDERLLVHNLEHGYIVAYYGEDAPEEQVTELKAHAQEQIDGKFKKIIVAPWQGELPEGANFSYTAWTVRQSCEDFDAAIFDVFVRNNHSGEGVAPEKGLTPHLEAGNGTIDPKGEAVLLPPLGEDAAPSESVSDPAEADADADADGGASEEPAEDSS